MISPFRRQQQMVRGLLSGAPERAAFVAQVAPAAPAAPAADTPAGQEYAVLRVLLHDNLRTLSEIQSHEARNPVKAELAKEFAPWIDGVLAAGEEGPAAQDEILVTNMIWAVDYRDVDYALRLGAHAIAHNLVLPDGYTRSVACFLAEDIAHLALAQAETVSLEQLLQLLRLVETKDMPDPVLARLNKAIGRAYWTKADAFDPAADNAPAGGKAAYLSEAFDHLSRALELDKNVGVKKDIERVARQLKDSTPPD